MKKRIAVFANGWSDEYLEEALEGLRRGAKEQNADLFLFLEYSSITDEKNSALGEVNILNLPDYSSFDGFVLMGNTLNNRGELSTLVERITSINKPVVCLEYEEPRVDCFCTDNYSGMRELCDHIIEEHGVKNVVFISGDEHNSENQERRRALEDALHNHGLELKPENIINGGWSYYNVRLYVPKWAETHELPDAFVCANDVMAMGTVYALELLGYEIPKDVIVTGFDNIVSARTFNPIITSVERDWSNRSYHGMLHLCDLMEGGERKGIVKLPSRLSIGESCRCTVSKEVKKAQSMHFNSAYAVPVERTMFDWHLQALDTIANEIKDLDEVHERFAKLFPEESEIGYKAYEGRTFCICLDESFVNSIYEGTPSRIVGYGERMEVIFAIRDGVPLPRQKINTSYIFPIFDSPEEEPNTYMIVPIHDTGSLVGYAVFKNKFKMIKMFNLNNWVTHISKCMIRVKQCIRMEIMNQKLSEMSIRDELSGLLNRKGYEKRAIPFLEQIRKEGKSGVLMVVDINKMKQINDRYGHLQGDLAIRLVSKAIMNTIPKNWYGVRYGGDEFVVIGENLFFDEGHLLQDNLCECVRKQAESLMLPFELTISVGTVIIKPNEDITIDEFFKKADNAMYDMKKRIHAERDD